MAYLDVPSQYRWDGKAKVATAWAPDTAEPNLCPTDTNCAVYLSHEQSQRQPPSFKVRFDQLVTKQCQPLVKSLFRDDPVSGSSSNTSQLSLTGPASASARSLSASSSCSLVLQPPPTANEHEALQYNITTRNFFAWIAGAPIVGTDPTFALIALKLRMDLWRNSSSDNTAAVRRYAQEQGYAAPTNLDSSTEQDLKDFVPSIAGYKLSSAPTSNSSQSNTNAAMRLRKSFGKRAGLRLKRKSEGIGSAESLPLNSSSSQLQSSEASTGTKTSGFGSEISLSDPVPSSSAKTGLSSPFPDVTSSSNMPADQSFGTDTSKGSSLSLGDAPPYTPLQLPKLEDILEPNWSSNESENDKENDKRKGKEVPTPQATSTSPLRQRPAMAEQLKAYNNTHTRHSSHRDRKRPHSRAGSGPPSPILEEAMEPIQSSNRGAVISKNKQVRRFSFDVGSDYPNHGSTSAHSAVTIPALVQQFSCSSDGLPHSNSHWNSTHRNHNVCNTCNRRKKPNLPAAVTSNPPPAAPETMHAVTEKEAPCESSVPITGHEAQPVLELTKTLGPSDAQEEENHQIHHRFPSLYGSRVAAQSTSAITVLRSTTDAVSRGSNQNSSRPVSQPSKTRFRSRTLSEGVYDDRNSARHGNRGTPLSEQCYTPSIHSTTSTKRRISHETVVALPSNPFIPVLPTEQDEYERQAKLGDFDVHQEATTLPDRTSLLEPFLPVERIETPVHVTCPEPDGFPVLMKSNGSKHPLALMLQDKNMSMVLGASMPAEDHQANISMMRDDTIALDRLLEGFRFIEHPPETMTSQNRSKTPTKTIPPLLNTNQPLGRSSQLSPASPTTTSSASFTSSRRSWTSSLRRWRSKDATLMDMYDSSPDRRPVSKNGQLQVRVLTMDSTGKFSTDFMDSPVEMGGFPEFR